MVMLAAIERIILKVRSRLVSWDLGEKGERAKKKPSGFRINVTCVRAACTR